VLRTRVPSQQELAALQLPAAAAAGSGAAVVWGGPAGGFLVRCGDGALLEVLQVWVGGFGVW
jgi:hypothetical protein